MGLTENERMYLREGYLIFTDKELIQKWIFKRRPELFPHDYIWFEYIEPEDRWMWGEIIEGIPLYRNPINI